MANIQRGDSVVTIGGLGDFVITKTVSRVNPNTLALVSFYEIDDRLVETALEPRQRPNAWRKYDKPKVERMISLADQVASDKKELLELYRSLPKIELGGI